MISYSLLLQSIANDPVVLQDTPSDPRGAPDALLHIIDQWERDNVAVRLDQDEKLHPLIPTGIDRRTGVARRRRLARRQQLRSSSEVGEHASPPLTPPGPGLLGAAGTARQAPSHSAPGRACPPAGCSPVRVHGRRVRQTGVGVGRRESGSAETAHRDAKGAVAGLTTSPSGFRTLPARACAPPARHPPPIPR